jgi:putative Holliday junction resolvase
MTGGMSEDRTGRVLAVDYGRRRVGLAISDPTGTITTGLGTLEVTSDADAVRQIAAGQSEWEYRRIVVGLPIETTGRHGPMAEAVLAFVEHLRAAVAVPIETLDERFSSAAAHRHLRQMGRRLKGRKHEVDQLAAELLLRQYLDTHGQRNQEPDEIHGGDD